jgi:hypothetical protein
VRRIWIAAIMLATMSVLSAQSKVFEVKLDATRTALVGTFTWDKELANDTQLAIVKELSKLPEISSASMGAGKLVIERQNTGDNWNVIIGNVRRLLESQAKQSGLGFSLTVPDEFLPGKPTNLRITQGIQIK